MDRDRFFSAEEAMDYGLIDRVIASHDLPRLPYGFRDGAGAGATPVAGASPARHR